MINQNQNPFEMKGQRQTNIFNTFDEIDKCNENKADMKVSANITIEKDQINIEPSKIINITKEVSTAAPPANSELGVSAEKLLNMDIIDIPFLIEGLIQKVGLAAIAGSSDTGKSAFLRYMCMSICSCKHEFLGFKINAEHYKGIYVSTEDDELSTANLLNKQNKDLGVDASDLSGLRFVFETEDLLERLDKMLISEPSDIVIIDAFTDLYTKSMNDVNQVRSFLNEYSQLAQKHKCLVMFLHHCGKRTEDFTPSKHNLIGSQGFEGKMRLVLELRSDLADVNYKHLCCVKGNYLPASDKNESFKLRFTENLTFENTNERIPFTDLKKTDESEADKAKYELASSLQSEGLSLDQIAQRLGYKNKSSVSRLLKKYSND